jgi:hypothetical protein
MERRNALKSMAMLIGGAVALPEWANAWSTNSITAKNWLRPNLASVLSEAVETIIPKTHQEQKTLDWTLLFKKW